MIDFGRFSRVDSVECFKLWKPIVSFERNSYQKRLSVKLRNLRLHEIGLVPAHSGISENKKGNEMKIDLGSKIGRREFLIRVVEAGTSTALAPAVLSVVGLGLPGCGNDSGSGGSGNTGGGGAPSVMFTVDRASGHNHTFSIPQTTLDTPPAGGYTASTGVSAGHAHTVTLSQADLVDIVASITVNGVTTVNSGHAHPYAF